ncbi:MAG: hypothetical protein FWF15_11525, partial [Oscillospiraceae bacterium]|nr:hypothetical protein [Oscillospiraceae bacterium]
MSDVDNMRIAEMPSLRKTPSLQSPTSSVSAKPKTIAGIKPENDFDMPFSETYNLTRLSPEEAAVRLKKFEEERKNWEKQENPIQTETDRAFKHPNPLPAEAHEDNILKRIQNIITKNGRFDYLSLHDVPISQCFFNKIDELGCKK